MPTKRKPIKETKTRYRAKRKVLSAKSSPTKLTLKWAEVESATEPIVLERNGQPIAVVIKYDEYQRLGAAQAEHHLLNRRESIVDNQLRMMAADPEIQNELHRIEAEFAWKQFSCAFKFVL